MQRLGRPRVGNSLSLAVIAPLVQARTLIYRPAKAIERRRRLQASRRRQNTSIPLFEIPPVLLDLDAEDNPHVRPYGKADEADQVQKWAHNPELDALEERLEDFRDELSKMETLSKTKWEKFSPWRTSDRDIVSAALLGSPVDTSSTANGAGAVGIAKQGGSSADRFSSEFLHKNGVPGRILHDNIKTLSFIFERRERLGSSSVSAEDAELLKIALRRLRQSGLPSISRVLSELVQTQEGCDLISRCDESIAEAIDENREAVIKLGSPQQIHSQQLDLLELLNNMAVSLDSRGLHLGPSLSNLGLQMAAATYEFSSMGKYLEAISGSSAESAGAIDAALSALFTSVVSHSEPESGHQKGLRAEVFSLLTGQGLTNSSLRPSLRQAIGKEEVYFRVYGLYIELLGELGAIRMLRHEWRNSMSYHIPTIVPATRQLDPISARDSGLFAKAFLRYIAQLRRRGDYEAQSLDVIAEDYVEDARLDLRSIIMQDMSANAYGGESSQRSDELSPGAMPAVGTDLRLPVEDALVKTGSRGVSAIQRLASHPFVDRFMSEWRKSSHSRKADAQHAVGRGS